MYSQNIIIIILVIIVNQVLGELKLTLLHTNDVHARVDQTSKYGTRCSANDAAKNKCYGGVSRRKTEVDRIRGENQNVLLLDAGDQFQGTLWFVVYNGDEAANFMNIIGYDAMAIGNHEFDRGPETLANFTDNVNFPILAANIDVSKEAHLAGRVRKSVVLQRGGSDIGIIGYVFENTPVVSNPGPNITFENIVESVRDEAQKLEAQGVDIIIALGHAGFEKDKEIAREVPEVDVVIGGRSSTFLYTGPEPSNDKSKGDYPFVVTQTSGKQVPVVQDFSYGKYLGYLQTTFNDNGDLTSFNGNPILLDSSIERDPALLQEVNDWYVEVREFSKHVTGHTYVDLNGRSSTCRYAECNLGNLITDAMVRMALKPPADGEWTMVAAAVANSGGIRSSLAKGKILRGDVLQVLPYRNTLTRIDLAGSDLIRMFEHSVEGFGNNYVTGRFLQVSGIKVKFDVSKSKWNRVVSLEILCHKCKDPVYEAVDPRKTYPILTNNFLRNGGDGYDLIKMNATNEMDIGLTIADVLADYIIKYSPIIHYLEGRIQVVNGTGDGQKVAMTTPVSVIQNTCPTSAAYTHYNTFYIYILTVLCVSLF